ncbi:AAA family ATPase [Chryseobacterium sp. MEBOG06]|uniref:AAA family ATPase n=1 Tax=Chryseobacterium sp. MEBOG06 TaxID=2879938 RepID=UPI001F21D528|nr:AAA family ATPase [Chryseobacterium sp. MEBOG06]UKB85751.1 AAA family ATPase [Chryseobacterium sp. MEBOG06]
MKKLCIITGGPGAGKTALLDELQRRGFQTVPEEGRRIIKEQIALNGNGLPWLNKKYFAELMFNASLERFQEINSGADSKIIFFDRGILDTSGYLKLENIPVSEEMQIKSAEMIYHKNVFILPPWKEIYENDQERKQTFEVAVSTFYCIKEIYLAYDYHVIEVPKGTVEKRADFILETIKVNQMFL